MKDLLWLSTGLGLLAFVLGALVGASHSPVAGVTITAAFGLAIPVFSFVHAKESHKRSDDQQNIAASSSRELAKAGKLLALFSLTFCLGLIVGAYSRVYDWPSARQQARKLPWTDKNAPIRAVHAIDWLVIQNHLLALGYTEEQIEQLYSIQFAAWKGNEQDSEPLSPLFAHEIPMESRPGGIITMQPNRPQIPMPNTRPQND